MQKYTCLIWSFFSKTANKKKRKTNTKNNTFFYRRKILHRIIFIYSLNPSNFLNQYRPNITTSPVALGKSNLRLRK
jgi:hypothetical protein